MAALYLNENASRMAPVADRAVAHAVLTTGEQVLDLGTGTGIVLERAAPLVGASGAVVGTDISAKMLSIAQQQVNMWGLSRFAGSFAATPPVSGVGPGVLADPSPFLEQLSESGLEPRVETETLGFDVDNFTLAWDVFAGVTTATLSPERRQEAKDAVMSAMWPDGDGPRHFRNVTHFIIGQKAR